MTATCAVTVTPIPINSASDLEKIGNDASYPDDGSYQLAADIDLSSLSNFMPIADFKGTFDGNGHKITGLSINSWNVARITDDGKYCAALFLCNEGTIENLTVCGSIYFTDNDIGFPGQYTYSGSYYDSAHADAGGIVGENSGSLVNCSNEVDITVKAMDTSTDADYSVVGGIAAYNGGNIEHCVNKGKISGSSEHQLTYTESTVFQMNIGGIVGEDGASVAKIEYCLNQGDISSTGNDCAFSTSKIGGIAGLGANIQNCSNSGQIATKNASTYAVHGFEMESSEATAYAGGIAGQAGSVKNCYNTGSVSAASSNITGGEDIEDDCSIAHAGGILGDSGDASFCYNTGTVNADAEGTACNQQVNGVAKSATDSYCIDTFTADANTAIFVSPDAMEQESTFSGFDFTNTWVIDQTNGGLPHLTGVDGNMSFPVVNNVSPESGAPGEGMSLTIEGSGFTGATGVQFGAADASFTVNSDTSITANVPAGTGIVDVTVTSPSGISAINSGDIFTYGHH